MSYHLHSGVCINQVAKVNLVHLNVTSRQLTTQNVYYTVVNCVLEVVLILLKVVVNLYMNFFIVVLNTRK